MYEPCHLFHFSTWLQDEKSENFGELPTVTAYVASVFYKIKIDSWCEDCHTQLNSM